MAEIAVCFVLEKLTTFLEEKFHMATNVKDDVEFVKGELERMTAFLRVAENDSDPQLKVLVKQVRELADQIEDIIDEYTIQIQDTNSCFPTFYCDKLKTQYDIASEIKGIKARTLDISEGRSRYELNNQRLSFSATAAAGGSSRRDDALLLEEDELVGIDEPKEELISLLINGGSKLKVVSVVGMGGLGKSTLVKKVFDDMTVRKHFHNHAWITVSNGYSVEEILRDTIQQLFDQMKIPVPQDIGNWSAKKLKAEIKDFLRCQKYLLVFDDVWSVREWEEINNVLPNGDQGSRAIVTTRDMKVASLCSVEEDVYKMKSLPENESWILFCQKTFQGNSCPAHLIDICRSFLRRCGGLPLAIVAISGLLSTKKASNIDEWKMVFDGLGSEIEGNDQLESMKSILLLSFNHLPYYLKPCYMYLSNYSEDHLIEHNTLIRLWIAEGFIERKDGKTVEGIARGYINELINRSLIHPVKTNDDGSVKTSRIHDFYREIILSKSKDQSFVTTTSSEQTMVWPKRVRRLSLHGSLNHDGVEKYGPRLSSLMSFHGGGDSLSVSRILNLIKTCRMLKILDLTGVPLEKFPKAILELFHLKYLCLRNTGIKKLPKSIKKLRKLEILDLKGTWITILPAGIRCLEKLRHLIAYHHVAGSFMPYDYVYGFKAFKGIGKLKSLVSLGFIEAYPGRRFLEEIAELSELKRVSITNLRSQDSLVLCSTVESLRKICSLGLKSVEGDILDLQHVTKPPPFLQRLYLGGRMEHFPHWIQSIHSLVKIYMRWSRLSDDPLQYLQDLPNLIHIEFLDAYVGQELCFKSGKFQKLKLLGLDQMKSLERVIFEKGSAPLLEKLIIQRSERLESVPDGIERLNNMKVLEFFNMPEEFISPLSSNKFGDQYRKVSHIPEAYHSHWKDGNWVVRSLHGVPEKQKFGKLGNDTVKTQEPRNWL